MNVWLFERVPDTEFKSLQIFENNIDTKYCLCENKVDYIQ